ncbi:sterile alpha motif domain-containing protein 3-like [Ixodes scapularis]
MKEQIHHDVDRSYPKKKFYFKAVNLLLLKYPALTDVTGTGYESWIVALRNKFKNERRKITGNVAVDENRSKFGGATRKRTANGGCAASETLSRGKVKRCLTMCTLPGVGEDATSLEAHEVWLCNEGKKVAPNEEQIDVRMDATASRRLRNLATMDVPSVKETYPYLMDARRFIKDFERQMKMEPMQAMAQGIASVISLATRKILSSKQDLLQDVENILAQDTECKRAKHNLALAALKILSSNVKEAAAFKLVFVKEDEETIPATPCVVYKGESVEEAEQLALHIDGVQLFGVVDAQEGLTAVMASYWLLGISYHKKAYNSCCMLERLGLNTVFSPMRAVAIKVFNKISLK